jgi:hypothetical protein
MGEVNPSWLSWQITHSPNSPSPLFIGTLERRASPSKVAKVPAAQLSGLSESSVALSTVKT